MKKILTFILFVIFVMMAAFPVVSAADLDDYLIIHYDFLGSTEDERLSDKAGESKENLIISKLNDGDTFVEEGRAVVDGENPGNYFASSLNLASGDGATLDKEATIFLVTKTETTKIGYGGWDDFFHIEGLTRMIVSSSEAGQYGNIAIRSNKIWNDGGNFSINETAPANTGATYFSEEWLNCAITYKLDETTGNIAVRFYFSDDGGKTYSEFAGRDVEPMVAGKVFADDKGDNTLAIQLGEVISATPLAKANGMAFEFSDFRLYNKALTLDEIKSVKTAAADEETTDATTTAPTTKPNEDTTAASTTAAPADNDTTASPTDETEKDASALPWIIAASIVVIVGVAIYIILKRKNRDTVE